MPRTALDKETKRAILEARSMIQAAEKADCNEAETRRRIERIFESLMGYDAFKHLSRERAVRGAGETEHVDFAIQLDEGDPAKPEIMVEITDRVWKDVRPDPEVEAIDLDAEEFSEADDLPLSLEE